METDANNIVAWKQSLEFRNKLIFVLSHEVNGLFANIMWMINTLETAMVQPETMKELLPELKTIIDKNFSVFQNTEEWIKLQRDTYKPVITKIKAGLFYENLHDFFAKQLETKELTFSFQGNEQLSFLSDEVLLSFVWRRIIENMIAFALPKKEMIWEALRDVENALLLRIKTEINSSDLQEIFCTDANFLTDNNLYSVFVKEIVIYMMKGTVDAVFEDKSLIITIRLPE